MERSTTGSPALSSRTPSRCTAVCAGLAARTVTVAKLPVPPLVRDWTPASRARIASRPASRRSSASPSILTWLPVRSSGATSPVRRSAGPSRGTSIGSSRSGPCAAAATDASASAAPARRAGRVPRGMGPDLRTRALRLAFHRRRRAGRIGTAQRVGEGAARLGRRGAHRRTTSRADAPRPARTSWRRGRSPGSSRAPRVRRPGRDGGREGPAGSPFPDPGEGAQWATMERAFVTYSCGGSRSVSLRSLFIPPSGRAGRAEPRRGGDGSPRARAALDPAAREEPVASRARAP